MRDLTFKRRVIKSAFEKAGLVPFNPKVVLDKIKVMSSFERAITPTCISKDEIDQSQYIIPTQKIRNIDIYTSFINLRISKAITRVQPVSPSVSRVIEKRDKAICIIALDNSLAKEELFKKAKAKKEKTRKKSRPSNHIQRYSAIYASNTRLKAITKNLRKEHYKAKIIKEKKAKFINDYNY